jgi:hypothetical protein
MALVCLALVCLALVCLALVCLALVCLALECLARERRIRGFVGGRVSLGSSCCPVSAPSGQ